MKTQIENAMLKAFANYEARHNNGSMPDVGDIVQVTNTRSKYLGRIGRIIKVKHSALIGSPFYTLIFTGNEVSRMGGHSFRMLTQEEIDNRKALIELLPKSPET